MASVEAETPEQKAKKDKKPTAPSPITGRNLTARILRQKIWRPANVNNDWSMFVIVGREGSGKSHTCLSVLEKCDPTFDASRAYFHVDQFLEAITEIPAEERQGKAIMLDEAGVGMGVRSWHDQDQINLNKLMQTARDDNMIVGMTLPRLNELDSQMRGRLHGFCEMRNVKKGEFAEMSWKNVSPTRDERNELYKYYPRLRVNGRQRPVKRLRIGPPSDGLVEEYEASKSEFKNSLYESTLEGMRDEEDDERSEKEIAEELIETGEWEDYVDTHNGNGQRYIQDEMIALDFDISGRKAGRIKKLLYRSEEVDVE